ncbi:MAG: exonuclease domain-containing protein, partial [Bacteroidota bacterium]
MYTIVDIETTGNGIKGNKITEISIFKYDGNGVVKEFTSLVNPECEIPYFITGLTGIDNHMVRNAPTIAEIAPSIEEITQNTIFVAHAVNFDYNVIKNEFKNLGLDFTRKKLCTVRLSRKLFPGYRSYSLGKLCTSMGIPLTNRHRARGDAHATVLLFERLLKAEGAEAVFKTFLNARSQEATLPPGLSKIIFDKLPAQPGIYYFKNKKGEIIYVGKSKNIKKRVLSHFYDKANKEVRMCRETSDIDFELSGSELVALLM